MAFDEHYLTMENARLREEVHRLRMIINHTESPSYINISSRNHMPLHDVSFATYGTQSSVVGEMYDEGGSDLPMSLPSDPNLEKTMIVELASAAMEELTRLALEGNPLWLPGNNQYGTEILNEDEYFRTFPGGIGPKLLGYRSEVSRHSALIIMNHINLIETLMNVKQWSKVFCGIVSRATTHEILSPGVNGNYNGALHVISAEFQVPSPFVPTRKAYFARYCKNHPDGSWAVVDVSLDNIRPNAIPTTCRRRPSGCLIQNSSNGYPKVTWVEHVEVDHGKVHDIYTHLVGSGLAFGATRWMALLERQCQRFASTIITTISTANRGVIISLEGRQGILKLAERMIMNFCTSVGSSTADVWSALSPAHDGVRVMSRTNTNDPGRPVGLVISVATSLWISVSPTKVFNFLREAKLRSQWDVICKTGLVQEKAHISNGREPGNCISLIQVLSENDNMFILQESCTDSTGSYVVYAPIDTDPMNIILSGVDPDCIALLPSGFAILPFGPNLSSSHIGGSLLDFGSGGSLITVAFQILVDCKPTTKLSANSVTTVKSLLKFSVEKIKNAIMSDVNNHFPSLPISQQ